MARKKIIHLRIIGGLHALGQQLDFFLWSVLHAGQQHVIAPPVGNAGCADLHRLVALSLAHQDFNRMRLRPFRTEVLAEVIPRAAVVYQLHEG